MHVTELSPNRDLNHPKMKEFMLITNEYVIQVLENI